jgi:hypothetical protein
VRDESDKLERAIRFLREPVHIDRDVDRRIMAEIESAPVPGAWSHRFWIALDWLRRGRPVRVSPLGGLAFAAGIAILVLIGRSWIAPQQPSAPLATTAEGSKVQFVIVAPAASRVSLVGDFNDWSSMATPMRRVGSNGVWEVTVPLDPGRYRYAFVVDGTTWLRDPSAPPELDDEFGRPGSVVTIGEL